MVPLDNEIGLEIKGGVRKKGDVHLLCSVSVQDVHLRLPGGGG